MKKFVVLILSILCIKFTFSQNSNEIILPAIIVEGDTIPYITLPEVTILTWRPFKTKKDEQATKRLINNVKKVYPYAKLASAKMKYYDNLAKNAKSDKEKKQIQKKAEEDIKLQFENDIRNMNRSQGKLLIKLIDRETGKSSYEIIKLSRGTFKAFFWQSFSSFFGIDLKDKYDPNGEDKTIELIISLIDKKLL